MAGPTLPTSSSSSGVEFVYGVSVGDGVSAITASGFISVFAILCLVLMFVTTHRSLKFSRTGTHLLLYFGCLLLSDALRATGAIMNLRWITLGGVSNDTFCTVQGAITQAGNVSGAIWSFTIASHVFNLLFLRFESTRLMSFALVGFGWCFTAVVVLLGPATIETKERGPYFATSGEWCWITQNYRLEQLLLQHLFEGLSVLLSLIFYALTLIRVRGNLIKVNNRWTLRFLSKEDSWKLDLNRDYTDITSIGLVKHMIWYPVAYAILILPSAITRISAFSGTRPPFGVTVFVEFVFDLSGLVDVVLFVTLNQIFPDAGSQPAFNARRKTIDPGVMENGVSPFTLDKPVDPDSRSIRTINSVTPLNVS
ncbi:hypothetical protein MIND_01212700 [Mycena indigotica]|uniref:Glucose receptor Git3 N-terminal domain-containing protein n=1 Tax=Mycena indigotica TaxID=2126181 RepID=A0A8H6S2V0_9AGAR|nr:uncharacterized protein MIND_01212700 [Mycena indigotica]KAF7291874.1 hypothetical protein MIND_01212700 [Mycena indigotica]